MRLAHSAALFALLASPLAAMADSITFGSGVSVVTYAGAPSNAPDPTPSSGTAVLYTGTSPYSVGNYVAPAIGTFYITYDDTTEYLPAGYTTYTTLVNGEGGGTGSIQFVADDSLVVSVNGVEVGSSSTFGSLTTDTITLAAGINTITFLVDNSPQPSGAANPTALDFLGTATVIPASVTPEPSSMVLLGTGLLAVAALGRRKLFHA